MKIQKSLLGKGGMQPFKSRRRQCLDKIYFGVLSFLIFLQAFFSFKVTYLFKNKFIIINHLVYLSYFNLEVII